MRNEAHPRLRAFLKLCISVGAEKSLVWAPLNPDRRAVFLWLPRDPTSGFDAMKRLVVISWWPFMPDLCSTLHLCHGERQLAALHKTHGVGYRAGLSSAGLGEHALSHLLYGYSSLQFWKHSSGLVFRFSVAHTFNSLSCEHVLYGCV